MPDWRELARQRLGALGIDPKREEEIIAELADHLEDSSEHWCQRGASVEDAASRALDEVPEWAELSREIHQAEQGEEAMNYRTKSLWLPGMVTLVVSMTLLLLIQHVDAAARFVWMKPSSYFVLYWLWLLCLPALGAMGAYWSRRVGGALRECALASVFPAVALACIILVVFPAALFLDPQVSAVQKVSALALFLLNWGLIPGAALFLGALPFVRKSPRVTVES